MRLQGAERDALIEGIRGLDEVELVHVWESGSPAGTR